MDKQILGRRFGNLVVIDKASENKSNTTYLCKCDCGQSVTRTKYSLINGSILFCSYSCPIRDNLTNRTFGKLYVQKPIYNEQKQKWFWLCKCTCGKEIIKDKKSLLSGNTKSCGCLKHEVLLKRNTTHNLSKHKLYKIWKDIKRRCSNKNRDDYYLYGGRGITVCNEWKSNAKAFIDWSLQNGWKEGLTIDRIDVNKGYSPGNCRWVDIITQANNKRTNRYIEYKGEVKSLKNWSRKLNTKYSCLLYRLNHGWSVQKAFETPSKKQFNL